MMQSKSSDGVVNSQRPPCHGRVLRRLRGSDVESSHSLTYSVGRVTVSSDFAVLFGHASDSSSFKDCAVCRTPRDPDVSVPRTQFLQLQAGQFDQVTPFPAAGSASCLPKKKGDVGATDGLLLLTRTSGAQRQTALAQRVKRLRESQAKFIQKEMVRLHRERLRFHFRS